MTSHDQLWKDLFRTFFPDLLFLLDSDLAQYLVGDLAPGSITFLDKELFHDLPEGERREVDLLAEPLAWALAALSWAGRGEEPG